jgi:DNA-binding transcriptional LysR family regulator
MTHRRCGSAIARPHLAQISETIVRPLKLDTVKAFLEVAKHGSFTTAARVLNLTQPAITHQVRELEQRFQIALFERAGNRVYLTAAGEKLAEYARPLIEQDLRTRTAMRRFIDGLVQRVRVGSSMSVLKYVLPPLLRRLRHDHPHLEIRVKTGLTATILQLLKEDQLDLGLCAIPIKDNADVFETVPLFADELVAIVPTQLGTLPEIITPTFLAHSPMIFCNKESALCRTVTDWFELTGQAPKPVMEFDNVEAIKSAVAVGLGSSIVPSASVRKLEVGQTNIVVRPISPSMFRQTGLVKLRSKHSTDAISIVYEALLTLRQSAGRPSSVA